MNSDAAGPLPELPGADADLVFVVDDDPDICDGFKRFLSQVGYRVRAFESAESALAEIQSDMPGVVVTDKDMDGMSGLEFAERAQELGLDVRFVLATGAGGETAAQSALRLGITDYLIKPVDLQDLARAVQKAFTERALEAFRQSMNQWLRDQVQEKTEQIRTVTLGALASLLNALEARIPDFTGHSQHVADCATSIAEALGLSADEIDAVRIAGLLHDIGMIGVPDAIVQKPEDLTPEERQAIQAHCREGAEILAPLAHLGPSITYVLEHHERLDGSGYPDAKGGEEISLGGQIVGLAEAWAALTETRPFRDRMSKADALATLVGTSDRWFSAKLLVALNSAVARL